ncbi:hypothetical protein Nepgr_004886 [Nepenthes gracilis]|uniref:Uncharacterized protein n=1 Tax=Nepenthes gracilis TaxID=150966 RepID=A0AAD3S2G5_NEPGR|nr:hypothetical protein Nepgr_004886 [Nepenthes gracilis]
MGSEVALLLIEHFSIAIDYATFLVVLFNFSVIGVLAVFMQKMAIFVTQSYLVAIGMLIAHWRCYLHLAAVLLPGGPLRLLVELAISRDEEIPTLVYEARPINFDESGQRNSVGQRLWRERPSGQDQNENLDSGVNSNEIPILVNVGEGQIASRDVELVYVHCCPNSKSSPIIHSHYLTAK